MYLPIIVMPLLGSIISGFFGRSIGIKGAHIITCSLIFSTTLLAIISFLETGLSNIPVIIDSLRWVDSEMLNIHWAFNFDAVTVSMLIPVLVVSSLVHLYSIGYMSHDPHNQRFFSYLSLFTFMMIILVTANNYLLMFVGWEGVGICSYLLVSFWFTRIAANQSSIAAILTNRVGDCLLTIGMFAILWTLGNLDYATVFSLSPFINENGLTIIGVCLLIGAMAKSSQIGLHVWLPMAMEGPTPVSALIHAATMVTAGVYLLIRSSPLIEYSSTVLLLCLWIGAITTVFSSLIGLFQQDIKKVIAYSTMSQLGLMVVAVGLSSYSLALFHLVNHAFYKALLFLGAGAVIHAVADNQDFRKYGGLKQFLPLSYSVMFIASLSLVAFPFMTGFYSKDFILESAYGQFHLSSITVYYIATVGAMFTTLYSVKTLYLTFIANPNGPIKDYHNAHEGNIYMSLPLVILAVFSIYFGFVSKDMFIGLGSDLFTDNSIFIYPSNEITINTEFAVPTVYKLLPLILTISLTLLSIVISEYLYKGLIKFKYTNVGYNIFSFFNLRFLVELVYNKYITEIILKMGGQTTKVLDKGAIELIGPYGLEKGLVNISKLISSLSTGVVTSYALYILIGGLAYIFTSYMSLFSSSSIIILILLLGSVIYFSSTSINSKSSIIKSSLGSILEVIIVTVPVLLTVAYVTVAERKTMASMQRRLGPNAVGYLGLLQAFADALKLILKEYVAPSQANLILFFIGPIVTLIFSLLAYAVVPFGPGITIFNFNLGILYLLAVSSLSTYGILLAGWSANSKYAFLGSLRSTAQLISYELILTSAILLVVFLTGSLNLSVNVEAQRAIWFIFPLLPVFVIFFIGSVAETNRAPFDLAEAESELVSGFMTEHSAVIFVFFFLAEYASIVFMCVLTSLLFLGGYLYDILNLFSFWEVYYFILTNSISFNLYDSTIINILLQGLLYALSLGFKTCVMVFVFIWVRASFPRIRYDQLMSYCWTILLPIVVSFIVVLPCILYSFDIIPCNITVL